MSTATTEAAVVAATPNAAPAIAAAATNKSIAFTEPQAVQISSVPSSALQPVQITTEPIAMRWSRTGNCSIKCWCLLCSEVQCTVHSSFDSTLGATLAATLATAMGATAAALAAFTAVAAVAAPALTLTATRSFFPSAHAAGQSKHSSD